MLRDLGPLKFVILLTVALILIAYYAESRILDCQQQVTDLSARVEALEKKKIRWERSKGFQPYEDRVALPVEDWMINDPSVKKGE